MMSRIAITEKDRRYLRQSLRMNPVFESGDYLALRREFLGRARFDQVDISADQDRGRQRDALFNQISAVQCEFWKLPLDHLQRTLASIDTRNFPEFGPVVNRLRTAAACRGEFPKLAQSKGMNLGLFNAFKAAAVLPPGDALRYKERFLRSIRERKHLKEVQKAVRIIQRDYPILYALEKDWFGTLTKTKIRRASVDYGAVGQESASSLLDYLSEMPWYSWWFVAVVIKMLLAAIMH